MLPGFGGISERRERVSHFRASAKCPPQPVMVDRIAGLCGNRLLEKLCGALGVAQHEVVLADQCQVSRGLLSSRQEQVERGLIDGERIQIQCPVVFCARRTKRHTDERNCK